MNYKILKDRHDELEKEVLEALRAEILKSDIESKFTIIRVIKVNVFDYVELGIIHGELTFMDASGLQYGIYNECSLEDLIDILTKI